MTQPITRSHFFDKWYCITQVVLVLSCIFTFESECVLAQILSPKIRWQRCCGGSDIDGLRSINRTSTNGYVLAGSSSSNNGDVSGNHGGGDVWLVRTDSLGSLLWQKCIGGTSSDGSTASINLLKNQLVFVGALSSTNAGFKSGGLVLRCDSTGVVQHEETIPGFIEDFSLLSSVASTLDSGYVVGGWESYSGEGYNNHGYIDALVVKYTQSGQREWVGCYGGSGSDEVGSVLQTNEGGYAFVGNTNSLNGDVTFLHGDTISPITDFWLVKLSALGKIEWQKCLGGTENEQATSVIQTSDSGFVLVGNTSSRDGDVVRRMNDTGSSSDIWFVKLNQHGDILWQRCYGGSGAEQCASVIQTSDGGFALVGNTSSNDGDVSGWHPGWNSFHQPNSDIWVLKLSSSGEILWQKCIGGSETDEGNSIIQISENKYVIGGTTSSNDGNITGNHGGGDMWLGEIEITSESILGDGSTTLEEALHVYPNPCNDNVVLKVLPTETLRSVNLFDIMGRKYSPTTSFESSYAYVLTRSLPIGVYMIEIGYSFQGNQFTYHSPLMVLH
ncbi:MAG: T9SS type A sorting domain-containing protein [bacterium]